MGEARAARVPFNHGGRRRARRNAESWLFEGPGAIARLAPSRVGQEGRLRSNRICRTIDSLFSGGGFLRAKSKLWLMDSLIGEANARLGRCRSPSPRRGDRDGVRPMVGSAQALSRSGALFRHIWMSDARWRRRLVPTTASTAFGARRRLRGAPSCMSVTGDHVFALAAGDDCFASGAYHPTMPVPAPPASIVGLFAQNGGSITAGSGATFVTVTANAAAGSYGIWSEGAATGTPLLPSQIDLAVPVTVTTPGASSFGLYASGGGAISTPGGLSVTTNGASSIGVYAWTASSTSRSRARRLSSTIPYRTAFRRTPAAL